MSFAYSTSLMASSYIVLMDDLIESTSSETNTLTRCLIKKKLNFFMFQINHAFQNNNAVS